MEDTGRIKKALKPAARRILFERTSDELIDLELTHALQVDQAHLVMLTERGIIDRDSAARIIRSIRGLLSSEFEALRKRPTSRGLYFLWEDYLIETEGINVAGVLQTARSRNDLNATVLKLRLREPYSGLLREGLRLQAVALRRARRYSGLIMPGYTHRQAAVPITYGHYLAGLAQALSRDFGALLDAGADLDACPLGAGALAGTSFPIDTLRTANLLGFEKGPSNSIDAVASRDLVLRLLAALAVYGVTLSRIAADLLEWCTAEFDFLRLPDDLVGSSSAMPQKRNPFLLEHVEGRSANALGAFVSAAAAVRGSGFTNSVAATSESVRPVWGALQDLVDITILTRMIVGGAQPNSEAMSRRAARGFTNALALANRLIAEAGLTFRTAHRMVGKAIPATFEAGATCLEEVAGPYLSSQGIDVSLDHLDPASVAASSEYGGGPGPTAMNHCLEGLRSDWSKHAQRRKIQLTRWRAASAALDSAARDLCTHKAAYFFCMDARQDPVAHRVFRAAARLLGLSPIELEIDNELVLQHVDAKGNTFLFVRTHAVISHEYPEYVSILRTRFDDLNFAGIVNWHEGANAPDKIFAVHTSGDVAAGVFGTAAPDYTRSLLLAIEGNRRAAGMSEWRTLAEATHWPGSLLGFSPNLIREYTAPLVEIEIGNTGPSWSDEAACEVVARSLTSVFDEDQRPVRAILCVGGIHFEPVFTEAVLGNPEHRLAVTHILPTCWLKSGNYDHPEGLRKLEACVDAVRSRLYAVAFHDSLKQPFKAQLKRLAQQYQLPLLGHRELRNTTTLNRAGRAGGCLF